MNLVSGRWWQTFGRLLVGLIMYIVAVFIIGAIAGAIAHGTTNVTLFELINGVVGALVTIVLAPFIAALINVIYIDLRVRKERVDHEMLLSGATPSGAPAGVEPLPGVGAPTAGEPSLEPPASEPPSAEPPSQAPPSAPPSSPGA
jgi:uncharacterized membrane protein YeaQ/YmgE (transglycosylase-associated protein family)